MMASRSRGCYRPERRGPVPHHPDRDALQGHPSRPSPGQVVRRARLCDCAGGCARQVRLGRRLLRSATSPTTASTPTSGWRGSRGSTASWGRWAVLRRLHPVEPGDSRQPALTAMAATVTTPDVYGNWFYTDGALNLAFALSWGVVSIDGRVAQFTGAYDWTRSTARCGRRRAVSRRAPRPALSRLGDPPHARRHWSALSHEDKYPPSVSRS